MSNTLESIKEIMKEYVPEWTLDEKSPDAGTRFTLAFARQMDQNYDIFEKMMEKHYAAFLNTLNPKPLVQRFAEGYAAFEPANDAPSGESVAAGFMIYSENTPFATTEEIYVTTAELVSAYLCCDGEIHNVIPAIQEEIETPINELRLFHSWALTDTDNITVHCWEQQFTKNEVKGNPPYISILPPLNTFGKQLGEIKLTLNECKAKTAQFFHGDVFVGEAGSCNFYPFGRSLMPLDAFFIACDEVFSRRGAEITIEMAYELRNSITQKPIPEKDASQFVTIDKLSFEYWNGADFAALSVKSTLTDTKNLKLEFTCPGDMELFQKNGIESRWLRVRIVGINEAAVPGKEASAPRIFAVPFITSIKIYAGKITPTPEEVMLRNNLDTVTVPGADAKGLSFKPLPITDAKHTMFFGFNQHFGGFPVKFLLVEPENGRRRTFEMYHKGNWKRIPVKDTTANFTETGIITLFSGDSSPLQLFGKELHWLRVTFDGMPKLKNFILNVTPIVQRPSEEDIETDGSSPAGTVTLMKSSLGFVQRVYNPLAISGGRLKESPQALMNRGARVLRHRNRAVTANDFESLAKECGVNLLKCKAFINHEKESRRIGIVEMVYMPESYPMPDSGIAKVIKAYLQERSHPVYASPGKLIVRETEYRKIEISAKISTNEIMNSGEAVDEVTSVLNKFLHPITGGFSGTGYGFGEAPNDEMIIQILYSIPWAAKVRLNANVNTIGETEMIQSGTHTVNINYNKEDLS